MPISAALGSSALLPAGLGFRNVIINGSMSISQRYGTTGISFGSGGGTLYYGTDRFSTEDYTWSAGSNPTVKQSTSTTEGFAFPSGFDYAYKINTGATGLTLASGGVIRIRHVVEGFNALPLYGKPCYLSFWVRSSKTGIYTINMNNGNWGAGQATRMISQEFTIDVANTWEYKTIPVNMGSATASGTWNKTNSYGLGIEWVLGANADRTGDTYKNAWQTFSSYHIRTASSVNWAADANATFYLTGVQLEQNTQPTPFEQRPYGIELALCQRYYYRVNGPTTAIYTSAGTTGVVGGPTAANRCGIVLPVPMRRTIVTGDFSYSSIAVYDQNAIPAVTSLAGINHLDGTHLTIDYVASAGGLTAGRAVVPLLYNIGSFYAINAEL